MVETVSVPSSIVNEDSPPAHRVLPTSPPRIVTEA